MSDTPTPPWLLRLHQAQAIAILRTDSFPQGLAMADAVLRAGFEFLEITLTSDRALALVHRLRQEWPDRCIGVGTLVQSRDLDEAIAAGAQYGFSPVTDPTLLAQAQTRQFPLVPGALTPTEIWQAWQVGAPAVKVFPIAPVGGSAYLSSLQIPLQGIPLIPTGGVTLEDGVAYLRAGAIAIGVSGSLFTPAILAGQQWSILQERAERLLHRLAIAHPPSVQPPPAIHRATIHRATIHRPPQSG